MPRTIDIPVPDLTGSRAVVTGASDGVGFEIAARLARAGAELILPVRHPGKGTDAAARIRDRVPTARIDVRPMDLASLASVASFADGLVADGVPLRILINNAGVMTPPTRQESADGFELQLAPTISGTSPSPRGSSPSSRAGVSSARSAWPPTSAPSSGTT